MKFIMIGFCVLLFALVTAALVLWGMRKAYFQRENLAKMLFSKSADAVMTYLKTHDSVTENKMLSLVEGIQASEFLSRNKAVVRSDRAFTAKLIEIMIHDGLIKKVKNGKNVYYVKN